MDHVHITPKRYITESRVVRAPEETSHVTSYLTNQPRYEPSSLLFSSLPFPSLPFPSLPSSEATRLLRPLHKFPFPFQETARSDPDACEGISCSDRTPHLSTKQNTAWHDCRKRRWRISSKKCPNVRPNAKESVYDIKSTGIVYRCSIRPRSRRDRI